MASFSMLINVGMNALGVQTGLNKIGNMVGGWANRQAGALQGRFAAAFGVGAIIEASRRAIKYADDLDTVAQRLGISTDALQEFGYSAKVNNAELEDFTTAIEKINSTRIDALKDPTGDMAESFKQLGVSLDDLKNKRAEDILKKISNAFQTGDPQKLIPFARDVAGRGIGKLAPALIEGLDVAAAAARRLGVVIDSHSIKGLAAFSDQMDIVAMELKAGFIPALRSAIEWTLRLYYKARADSSLGRIASFLGARSTGASREESLKVVDEVANGTRPFMDNIIEEIKSAQKRREEILENLRKGMFEAPEDDDPEKKTKKVGGGNAGGALVVRTENQRVGAFINPVAFAFEKEQVAVLKKIESNTRQRKQREGDDIYLNT